MNCRHLNLIFDGFSHESGDLDYRGFHNNTFCYYDKFINKDGKCVIIFTDGNDGTSITNSVENVIKSAIKEFGLSKEDILSDKIIFIETYEFNDYMDKINISVFDQNEEPKVSWSRVSSFNLNDIV